MNLEHQDLIKLARLARLGISASEAKDVLPALDSVISWVGELAQAPVNGVEPMAHPHDLALRLREDSPQPLQDRDELMQNAPQAAAGLFVVPRVVE